MNDTLKTIVVWGFGGLAAGVVIGALLAIADAPFWMFLPVIIAVGVVWECLVPVRELDVGAV